jgi:hypothetical protein
MPVVSGGGASGAISGVTVTGTAAASQVPVASSSSAGAWAYPPGFEINYTQITAGVNVASTTEATPTTIISPGAITFDGTAVLVHFYSPAVKPPTAAAGDFLRVSLYEGATEIGLVAFLQQPASTAQESVPVTGWLRFTPTAASHTYTIGASVNSTTGTPTISAGAGGTATFVGAFVRFTKV